MVSLVNKILCVAVRGDLKPVVLSKRKIKGEIDRQCLSTLKAKRMLDWGCRYSLGEGLRLIFNWYSNYLGDKNG